MIQSQMHRIVETLAHENPIEAKLDFNKHGANVH